MAVPTLEPTAAPDELGLDSERLDRITEHFDRYVTRGLLSGFVASVSRGGEVAWVASSGLADLERSIPMTAAHRFRIYSMTKPIVSVAAMMLFERGLLRLNDPIAPIIDAFHAPMVLTGGTEDAPEVSPSGEPIRLWHLLSHTSGMTYGFQYNHLTDALYRKAGFEWGWPAGIDLAEACRRLEQLPLRFTPGTGWNYGMSTDVLGRVLEVVVGKPLDQVLDEMVFEPLAMADTGFFVPDEGLASLAQLYGPDVTQGGRAVAIDFLALPPGERPSMLSGGGGLYSTPYDYARFTRMLLNGGELDGVRLLGPRTVEHMVRNHLPGGVDLEHLAQDMFSETSYKGVGFGLGFSVVIDEAAHKVPVTEGSFSWGGAASTVFWVDPTEALEVSFFTQLLPSGTHPIRDELAQLVYAAVVD